MANAINKSYMHYFSLINSLIISLVFINLTSNIFIKYITITTYALSVAIGLFLEVRLDYNKISKIYDYYLIPAIIPLLLNLQINNYLLFLYLIGVFFQNIINVRFFLEKKSNLILCFLIILSTIFGLLVIPFPLLVNWKIFASNLILFRILITKEADLKFNIKKLEILLSLGLIISFNLLIFLPNYLDSFANIIIFIYSFIFGIICFRIRNQHLLYFLTLTIILVCSFIIPNITFEDYSIEVSFITALAMLIFIKSPVLYSMKTAYGKIEIIEDRKNEKYILFNNYIIHGYQYKDKEISNMPTSYLGTETGIGNFFKAIPPNQIKTIGVIGLGCGTIAAYGQEYQNIDFYEINKEIINFAKNFFTYLSNSKSSIIIIEGDARKKLIENSTPYDLLICDGYIGDVIPSSLLTYEAFQLYLKNVKNNGFLMIHISSKSPQIINYISRIVTEFKLYAYLYDFTQKPKKKIENLDRIGLITNILPQNKVYKFIEQILEYSNKFFSNFSIRDNKILENDNSRWLIIAREQDMLNSIIQDNNWKRLDLDYTSELINDYKIGYK